MSLSFYGGTGLFVRENPVHWACSDVQLVTDVRHIMCTCTGYLDMSDGQLTDRHGCCKSAVPV